MTDLEQRIFNLAKKRQIVNIATITEDSKPRVRYVIGNIDKSMTFRFSTHIDSNKSSQIASNPNVFLTLGANSVLANNWLQVEGTAKITTTTEERQSFWFSALDNYFQGIDDPRYCIVIVKPSTIQLCSMGGEHETWQHQ